MACRWRNITTIITIIIGARLLFAGITTTIITTIAATIIITTITANTWPFRAATLNIRSIGNGPRGNAGPFLLR